MRKAYVSGITNDAFLKGALIMFASLNSCCIESNIDRVCFITDNVSAQAQNELARHNIILRHVGPIQNSGTGRWATTFQKISIFSFTEYDKIVWLDADMMITGNLDSLFEWPHMSCVRSRASLDGYAGLYPFNSGIMVIEPREKEFEEICTIIPKVVEDYQLQGKPLGDQNVLNVYFSGWPWQPEKHLPDGYNVFWGSIENYIDDGFTVYGDDGMKISVLHFTGKHKPWNKYGWFVVKSFIRSIRYNRRFPSNDVWKVLCHFREYQQRMLIR